MPSNILILPLLAGFLFLRICLFTKYRSQALDGYRLLLESALTGLLLLAFARLVVVVAQLARPEWVRQWKEVADVPYLGSGIGSVLSAVCLAAAINIPQWESWRRAFYRGRLRTLSRRRFARYFAAWKPSWWRRALDAAAFWKPSPRQGRRLRAAALKRLAALTWATQQQKNYLLQLLNRAVRDQITISVTLSNRKFYVGYVGNYPSLSPEETFFSLYPIMSGYRDKDTLRFEKTTDYDQVSDDVSEPFTVLLPIKDVQIANPFDAAVWRRNFEIAPKS